jgi:hypothetical protein
MSFLENYVQSQVWSLKKILDVKDKNSVLRIILTFLCPLVLLSKVCLLHSDVIYVLPEVLYKHLLQRSKFLLLTQCILYMYHLCAILNLYPVCRNTTQVFCWKLVFCLICMYFWHMNHPLLHI